MWHFTFLFHGEEENHGDVDLLLDHGKKRNIEDVQLNS